MSNSFGENVRRYRNMLGWTQEAFGSEVSKIIGNKERFSKSVSQWENGLIPPMETVLAIAKLLDITLDDLFYKEIENFKTNYEYNITAETRFADWEDEDVEFIGNILKGLNYGIWQDDENGNFECFSAIQWFSKAELYTDMFSPDGGVAGFVDELRISEWIKNDYLKKYIKRNIFLPDAVCVTYNIAEGPSFSEDGWDVDVALSLDENGIKEFFEEYSKRKHEKLIKKLKKQKETLE